MELITIKEVSKILSIKPSTLYEWVRISAIPSYRINGVIRFDINELYEWIKCKRTNDTNKREFNKKNKPKTNKNTNLNAIIESAIEEYN